MGRSIAILAAVQFLALLAPKTADAALAIVQLRSADVTTVSPNPLKGPTDYLPPDVVALVKAVEATHGFAATHVFGVVIRGFSADLTPAQIDSLAMDPRVESIEVGADVETKGSAWHLARIGPPVTPPPAPVLLSEFSGLRAYVVDTGVNALPTVRLQTAVTFVNDDPADCNGHGTDVAELLAGAGPTEERPMAPMGVVPGASIVSVKVLDCAGIGRVDTVIKGLDWIAAQEPKGAVVNMSLGGGFAPSLDRAIRALAARGFFVAVAAGNSADDACASSPASGATAQGVVSVAATNAEDEEADFSNYGACVDIWAPGVSIATHATAEGLQETRSGTSLSAPLVAGAALLLLHERPDATPAEMEETLMATAEIPGTASKDGRTIARLQVPRR